MSTLVCLFNNIVLTGGPGVEEEQVGTAVVPAQSGLIVIGLGFEEAVAVAVTVAIITKIICGCGLLFIEYMFVSLLGGILQTIIGLFAALFAAILSNFSGDIDGDIDHINGYKFTARVAAYFPISNGLFEGLFTVGIDTYFIMVCGFIVVILSSINGLISAIGVATITIIGGYLVCVNKFSLAALSAITVITEVTRNGFDFSGVLSPAQQAAITQTQQRHTTAPPIDSIDKICLTGVGLSDFDINEYVFGLVFNEYVFNNEINSIFDIYFNGNEIIFNCGSLIPQTPTTTTTRREKNIYVIADAFYAAANENKCGISLLCLLFFFYFLFLYK